MHKNLEVRIYAFAEGLDAEKGHVSVDSGTERWEVPGGACMEDKSALEARIPMGEGNSKLFRYHEPDIGNLLLSDRPPPIDWTLLSNGQSDFPRGNNASARFIQEAN
jgi:hypothetical protein